MKFAATNRHNKTAQAFTSFRWIGAGYTLAHRIVHGLLTAAAWYFLLNLPLKSQPTTTSIHVTELRCNRELGTVTIRWNGGFPPYHVRFTSDLNGSWTSYARPIATNELSIPTPNKGAMFFQVFTEFEPLQLTAINYAADGAYVLMQWKGGTPPFEVQIFNASSDRWESHSGLLNQRHYEGLSFGNTGLFRIASVPDMTPPKPPSELILYGARCDRVAIGWRESNDGAFGSGICGYAVYRNDGQISQVAPRTMLFLDDNLIPNSTNIYRIAAIDIMGNEGALSEPLTVVTPDCSVNDTNVYYENSRLTLAWDKNEEPVVGGYLVYWGNKPGEYPWQIDVMQANQVTISDLTPGQVYFISVTAYTTDGIESDPAPELIFIPPSRVESSYAAKALVPPTEPLADKLPAK